MRISRGAAVAVVALAALVVAIAAGASGGSRHIRAFDDCDPATFNANVGPGTCVGDGKTLFPNFIGQLIAKGSADGWSFGPSTLNLERGRSIEVENRGGEFHTFTEVANFGGGCVPVLNGILHLTPVPECPAGATPGKPATFGPTGILPDGELNVAGLTVGVHKFQCLIHPWMHATVTVRARNNNDDD